MNSGPFISVIVPYLNEEKFIGDCARSLTDQEYDPRNYELIFIDNGSTDSSKKILNSFSKITHLQERRPNVYAARNSGLAIARGEIIAFTDADCIVRRDWLSVMADGFQSRGADIVMGYRELGNNDSRFLSLFADYENRKAEYVVHRLSKEYYFGYTNNMAFRAELFKRCGPFREFRVEGAGDTEFVQRCAECYPDLRVAVLPGMKVCHQEIQNVTDWFRKLTVYGRINQDLKAISRYQPLGIRDKYNIILDVWSGDQSSFLEKMSLLTGLTVGQICYAWGMVSSRSRSC